VYVEEVNTGPRPIEGVSTSTTGFVGETERGSTKPRLVTSWQDYYRWYGGYIDRPPFGAAGTGSAKFYPPHPGQGVFDNGGQRLFIARVIGDASVTATGNLPGGAGTTDISALGKGEWGNHVVVRCLQASAALGAAGPPAQWFRLQAIYYRGPIPNP